MKAIQIIALVWLVLIASLFYGMEAADNDYWPYPVIQEIRNFVAGDAEEATSITEKVENDLGMVPARHLVDPPDLSKLGPGYGFLPVPVRDRRGPPVMYLAADAPVGYRVIYGVFDLETTLHGAILIAPDGTVANIWSITQEDVSWPHPSDANVFPHGFAVTRDGSIIVAYDHGTSMTRYDYCGNVIWRSVGGYHHSIEMFDDETLWVWGNNGEPSQFGDTMHQVRIESGEVIRSITINDMIRSNPEIDIFGIRQADDEHQSRWVLTGGNPFHQNDIDPLPEALAANYPGLEAGDLLISMRSPNLVYVLDPATVKVKWWRQGLTRRQHDPDWNERGTITIFDNNMHRDYSRIVELDPQTFNSRIILDGSDYDFYSWHRGKHQQLPDGHLLVTSTAQGRVFEVAPDGEVTFDFLNLYTPDRGALTVSEARFLPPDYFEELPSCP